MKKTCGITVDSIIADHSYIVRATENEVIEMACDRDRLDSALNSIFQTYDNVELYPTKEEKAARLFFNLSTSHSFMDGNKRIALFEMLKFLRRSGIKVKINDEELEQLSHKVIEKKGYNYVVDWINGHKYIEEEMGLSK